jgi:transposase
LAQQLRGNFLSPVFHQDNFYSQLRSVVGAYQDLVKDLVRQQNRYKALYRSEARNTDGVKLYKDEKRIRELANETERFVAKSFFNQIQILKAQKTEYVKLFQKYEKENSQIRHLSSMPGIGEVRACQIAAIVCSPNRFENKHKFWAYCMLVKYDQRSDNVSYGKKRAVGNTTLKNVFMGAAQTNLDHNKELKKYYDEHRERGLDHRTAKKKSSKKNSSYCAVRDAKR